MPSMSPTRRAPRRALALLAGTAIGLVSAAAAPAQEAAQRDGDDRVFVLGRRTGLEESSISKLTAPLVETPQSISTVPLRELESRAVSNLDEALRTVPGVTLGAGEFSWQGNSPTIRGFVARSDMFLDGMRDFGNYYRDPFNLQQLEILEGPSSIYFGRGSTGGVINQTSKVPTGEAATSLDVAAGTADTYRVVADLERPITDAASARLTAMKHHGEVEGRDVGESDRFGFAPSLALGLGTPTRLTASWLHQEENDTPDYGLPWNRDLGRPADVDPSNFYGFTDDYLDTKVDVTTLRAEHDLARGLTVRDQLRYAEYGRDFRIAEPVLPTPIGGPLESARVSLNMWSGESQETFLENQLDVLARFQTGGIGHTLAAGVEAGRETSSPVFRNSFDPDPNDGVNVLSVSLIDPERGRSFADAATYDRLVADTDADSLAFYAVDTIALGPQWEATLGARWDRFEADYFSTSYTPSGAVASTAHIPQTDEKPSFRGALVYKPTEALNVYAAAGTSFNPSAESLTQITSGRALQTNNADLDPEENESYEVGAKLELFGGKATATGSVFRLEKTNARVPDPANPGFNMLGGEQRVDGVQLQLQGDLTDALYVSAGYTYLDSEVTKSAAGAAPVGRPLINAPEHSASVLAEYQVSPVATLGLSATYMAERLAQNTGTTPLVAPDYVTVDAMARYALSEHIALQLNAFNLGDETYFDQIHAWHIVPGPRRSALLTLQVRY